MYFQGYLDIDSKLTGNSLFRHALLRSFSLSFSPPLPDRVDQTRDIYTCDNSLLINTTTHTMAVHLQSFNIPDANPWDKAKQVRSLISL